MKKLKMLCLVGVISVLASCASGGRVNIKEFSQLVSDHEKSLKGNKVGSILYIDNFDTDQLNITDYYPVVIIQYDLNNYYYEIVKTEDKTAYEYFYDEETSYFYSLSFDYENEADYIGTKELVSKEEALDKLSSIEEVTNSKIVYNAALNIMNEAISNKNIYYINPNDLTVVEEKMYNEDDEYLLMIQNEDMSHIITINEDDGVVSFTPYKEGWIIDKTDTYLWSDYNCRHLNKNTSYLNPLQRDELYGTSTMDLYTIEEI